MEKEKRRRALSQKTRNEYKTTPNSHEPFARISQPSLFATALHAGAALALLFVFMEGVGVYQSFARTSILPLLASVASTVQVPEKDFVLQHNTISPTVMSTRLPLPVAFTQAVGNIYDASFGAMERVSVQGFTFVDTVKVDVLRRYRDVIARIQTGIQISLQQDCQYSYGL